MAYGGIDVTPGKFNNWFGGSMKRIVLPLILLAGMVYGQTKVLIGTAKRTMADATKTATYAGGAAIINADSGQNLIITLKVTAADAGGTYDFYITTSDGVSSWDVVHFTQIAGSAVTYTATVSGTILSQQVTTATPGVAANTSGTMSTGTAGSAEGIKTLAAGKVRHGPWGTTLGYEMVAGGSVTTGVAYTITVTMK